MKLVTINGLHKKAFGKLKIADNGVLLNTAYTVHVPNWRQEFLCIFFQVLPIKQTSFAVCRIWKIFALKIYKILKQFIFSKAILRFDQIKHF